MDYSTDLPGFVVNAVLSECLRAESEGREPQNKGCFYQLLETHSDVLQEDDWFLMIYYFSTVVERNTAKYLSNCSAGNLATNHCSKPERDISLPFAIASIT